MGKDLSNIKLKQNSGINLNFEDVNKNANVLIVGNTVGFFGYVSNGSFVTNIGGDLKRLGWLIKCIQKKVNFTILGEIEERKYYSELFGTIKNKYRLNFKVKFYETVEPKDYFEYFKKFENMPKFDYLISNPPFDGKSGIHLKCIEKYKDICTKGIIISPDQWLKRSNINRPFGKYRKILNGYIKDIEHLDHRSSNNYFGLANGIESLGIYFMEKNNELDLENYGMTKIESSLYHKINISRHNKDILTFNSCKANDEFGYMKWKNHPIIRVEFDVPTYAWHGGDNCYNAVIMDEKRQQKGISFTLRFKSQDEVKHFKESLKTKFMKWYYWNFVVPGDCKLMNYMFRLKDYSKPVTNETFYKIFDLTEEEINIIENFNYDNC